MLHLQVDHFLGGYADPWIDTTGDGEGERRHDSDSKDVDRSRTVIASFSPNSTDFQLLCCFT